MLAEVFGPRAAFPHGAGADISNRRRGGGTDPAARARPPRAEGDRHETQPTPTDEALRAGRDRRDDGDEHCARLGHGQRGSPRRRAPPNYACSPGLESLEKLTTGESEHSVWLSSTPPRHQKARTTPRAARDALLHNTTGNDNTASGYAHSPKTPPASTTPRAATRRSSTTNTGNDNTAHGLEALISNTTGNDNTANGLEALATNTTGTDNTATASMRSTPHEPAARTPRAASKRSTTTPPAPNNTASGSKRSSPTPPAKRHRELEPRKRARQKHSMAGERSTPTSTGTRTRRAASALLER